MRSRVARLILFAPLAILGLLLFAAVGGALVMLLWNWLLPSLFGLPQIGFWQALGLLALCRILFGGWGAHGSTRSRIRRRVEERWKERWSSMTDEEKERFRQRVRERCGFGPEHRESSD